MSSCSIGDYQSDLPVAYDLAMQFDALPKHSVILLINDADDEFPAQWTVLFPAHFDITFSSKHKSHEYGPSHNRCSTRSF